MSDIRVRFAPSPTGTLHIGGARTALFNYLYAKNKQGKLVLRVEDTDLNRSTEDSARGIVEGLRWLGLSWDEGPDVGGPYGPYRQSERLPIYQRYLQQLLDEGKAYYCFCSAEELAAQRANNLGYAGTCRSMDSAEISRRLNEGQPAVIRFKSPLDGQTTVNDLIRGSVSFENRLFDDFIIAKSDGWPTYNFAVVVDDYTMRISHVIRAEEHLSNTPKQILLYEALGFTLPQFAHVSMILAPDRSKLSKRHGATSVQEFRDDGYLPEAMLNYLALLGWSPGEDIDFLTLEEMIDRFDLNNVSKSAAIYDIDKLSWMNGHYLTEIDPEQLLLLLKPRLKNEWLSFRGDAYLINVLNLVRGRAKTLAEMAPSIEYFFEEITGYDEKGVQKHFLKSGALERLTILLDIMEKEPSFTAEDLESKLRSTAEDRGMKAGDLIHPARLALSGRTNTPGLFEVMELLGRKTCVGRVQDAIHYVKSLSQVS